MSDKSMSHLTTSSLVALVVAGAAAFACSGPAAGEAVYTNGEVKVGADKSSSGEPRNGSTTSSTSTSGGGATDAFFKTVPYNYDQGRPPNNADDNAGTHTGLIPLAGKECAVAGCHLDKGPKWVMSGTVFSAKTGGTPVPKVQIGVYTEADNKITDCYSDAQGNFWLESDTPIPAGAKVAVRKADGEASLPMVTPLPAPPTGGNCNLAAGCHGDTNRIYVN
ncbi:MAG: hypothetical protein KIT84_42430 [Labilithrix sp.]|nr:hypothetical protein [Labilithrix sp.]MCW5817734.1 hypothetical protein [Labilithrix sp.]